MDEAAGEPEARLGTRGEALLGDESEPRLDFGRAGGVNDDGGGPVELAALDADDRRLGSGGRGGIARMDRSCERPLVVWLVGLKRGDEAVEECGETERIETSEFESCRLCRGTGGIGMPEGRARFVGVEDGEVEEPVLVADDPLAVRDAWEGGVRSEVVDADAVEFGLWKWEGVIACLPL